jgi:hypothetical protein
MGRIDSAGRIIASLAGDVANLERLQGATGITTPNLMRALQEGGLDAATATPEEVYRIHTALRLGEPLDLPGPAREFVPPVRPSEAGPAPKTMEERIASDPEIMRSIEGYDPELAGRVRGADSDVILDAYRQAAAADGVRPTRQMELPLGDGMTGDRAGAHSALRKDWPAPFDADEEEFLSAINELSPAQQRYMRALQADDWMGFDYPSQAASAGLAYGDAPSRWEMSPELLAARQALIDSYPRGPGVPGRLSGPGRVVPSPTGLIPAPPRGIPGETRAMSVPGSRVLSVPPDQRAAESIAAQFDRTTSPLRLEHRNIDVDDALLQQAPFMRGEVPQAPVRSGNGRKLAAAAAAATGAGIIATMPGDRTAQAPATADDPAFTSGGEADLVEETRPAPKVAATAETPQPTVKQGPQDYSLQARALINRLNDMRRAAGGEVPEAQSIMAEVNRLIAMGNEQRRQPAFVPGDDASAKFKQAQELINQVNAMYRQGMTPNSPQVQAVMRQVRQLQSDGDAMRNRRAG